MQHLRITSLLWFGLVVFGSVQTAMADVQYSFTTIDVPAPVPDTYALGINDSGQVVGYYTSNAGDRGFLYTAGSFTTINVPGAIGTRAYGINDSGQIVGLAGNHGFLLDTASSFTTIDVPGAASTYATGINNSGQIVGSYFSFGGPNHGFLYTAGSFTTIDVPGAEFTQGAFGINDSGQIVGYYYVRDQR
jgi:probable HAF family extracellular repeat protein